MDETFYLMFFFGIVLIVFGMKALSIYEKRVQNQYKLEKKKIKVKRSTGKMRDRDDDDGTDYEEFIESLPQWLKGMADGAKINLEAVYDGDEAELMKVRELLNKNLGEGNAQTYL